MGEYLRDGWFINMSVAIDFTASNGDPELPSSLHHYNPAANDSDCEPNAYEKAMRKVGGILETYAYKKKFAAYGFGGVPKNEIQVSHCFNINGNPDDPTIDGLENLIAEYQNSLSSVRQWGPTKFSRIMNHMDNVILEQIQKKIEMYHILFILTDGVVHDMK